MSQTTHFSPLIFLLILTCTITNAIPILTPSFDTIPSFDTTTSSSFETTFSPPGGELYHPTGNTEEPRLPDTGSLPLSLIISNNYQPENSDILFSEYTDPSSDSSIGEKEEKTTSVPAKKVDPLGELIKDNPIPHQEVCCQTNNAGTETCWPVDNSSQCRGLKLMDCPANYASVQNDCKEKQTWLW